MSQHPFEPGCATSVVHGSASQACVALSSMLTLAIPRQIASNRSVAQQHLEVRVMQIGWAKCSQNGWTCSSIFHL